jgi:GNAT superfamily N-acetyltransferase
MPDMIVRLYDLPPLEPAVQACAAAGIAVRPALAMEKPRVLEWVAQHFAAWVPEVEATFHRQPVACVIAVHGAELAGFAAYDAACRNFFGPTGVAEAWRGRGVGRALLLAALHAQRAQGYAYAIIGGVGPAEYYAKAVGARAIDGSTPGIYGGALRRGAPAA